MEDDRNIVVDCFVCSRVIWAGSPCPECARRKLMGELPVGGPLVDDGKPAEAAPKNLRGGLR